MISEPLTPAAAAPRGLLALATEDLTDQQLLDRFVRRRDEVAFEALVQRHGPMVLAVCRRVLGQAQEADDAFQATFLVLLRKADSIAKPELLGSWLYGVACRVARKARAQAASRRAHESAREAVAMPPPDPLLEVAWRELRALLDEELQHLPPKYQAPLVLCYLEGLTNEEAARRLGWPSGSISYRLARARELLKARLSRRCKALSPALLGAVLASAAPPLTGLPTGLADTLVRVAAAMCRGETAALALLSPAVTALAEEAGRALVALGHRTLLVVLAALGALTFAGGSIAYAALALGAGGHPCP
jgi:RNA polymerase sigma factor (sigma-70 family)